MYRATNITAIFSCLLGSSVSLTYDAGSFLGFSAHIVPSAYAFDLGKAIQRAVTIPRELRKPIEDALTIPGRDGPSLEPPDAPFILPDLDEITPGHIFPVCWFHRDCDRSNLEEARRENVTIGNLPVERLQVIQPVYSGLFVGSHFHIRASNHNSFPILCSYDYVFSHDDFGIRKTRSMEGTFTASANVTGLVVAVTGSWVYPELEEGLDVQCVQA